MTAWLATLSLVEIQLLSLSLLLELEAGLLALVSELVSELALALVWLLWRGKLQWTLSLEVHLWWCQLGTLCMQKHQTKLRSKSLRRKQCKTLHPQRIDQRCRQSRKQMRRFVRFVLVL